MNRKTRTVLSLAIVAAIAGYTLLKPKADRAEAGSPAANAPVAVAPARPVTLGRLAFKPCSLSSPMSRDSVEAQCTRFEVPEDRSQPNGRKIALNIAWLKSTNQGEAMPDPVFFLAGGPGQAAVATYPAMDPVLEDVRK